MQRLVVGLSRLVTNTFFRRIEVVGLENVPAEGPVIFAGNHPNALMDGWLLVARCGRAPVHFLAHAKLWEYPVLGWLMNLSSAVPVRSGSGQGGDVDNRAAFERLHDVLRAGQCVGVFPEGLSHVKSQLARLKTGTARIALDAAARHETRVPIVPCGLNYLHRHRFRSQVVLDFGAPILISDDHLAAYAEHPESAVRALTESITTALLGVTINAPDWNTMRFAQITRRLYKPSAVHLAPAQYVELNRRFLAGYVAHSADPQLLAFREDAENYQARLDMLGIRDHQLRRALSPASIARRIASRALLMLLLLPLAVPAALVHLPVGWVAAVVGARFSYEQDDEATLKVFATLAVLPVLYVAIVTLVAWSAGGGWALLTAAILVVSTMASMRLLEAETNLLLSTLSLFRILRLEREIEELRAQRAKLVERVRYLVDRRVPPDMQRIFGHGDFAGQSPADES